MDLMIIFGGICGIVILVALIAAIATVVSTAGAITDEEENEE